MSWTTVSLFVNSMQKSSPAGASIALTIPVAGIDTRESQRDAHLRSADFFDADTYPVITFASSAIDKVGDHFRVTGDLTIRGVTRRITFDVTSGGRVRDPWGNERVGYSATTRLNRSDFGLRWNQALETGGVLVGDEVAVTVELELVRN